MQSHDNFVTWKRSFVKHLLPNPGTLVVVLLLLWVQNTGAAPWSAPAAAPGSATTINYQGRLFTSSGQAVNGTVSLAFSLYNQVSNGTRLWGPEIHNGVTVTDGLFSVLLGSQLPIPLSAITGDLWLETKVGSETLSPREQLGAVPYAMVAKTVPDGSITTGKLNIDAALDLKNQILSNVGAIDGNNGNFIISNNAGNLRLRTPNSILAFIDTDNNTTGAIFQILTNNGSLNPPVTGLLTLNENGDLSVSGSVSHGAVIENNLQTPLELAANRIDRFSEGDVLCWGEDRLELCSEFSASLVQAVADVNGKPIIMGAEAIKVVGPVQRGDMLVASDVPGYAVANNRPAPGSVIAQALEDFSGQQGVIKAMIRKF